MRIAYYIAAHHKPYQLSWLLSAIADDDDVFLVHVDKKTNGDTDRAIHSISQKLCNNPTMLQRHSVSWGGWSQVSTEISAIKEALTLDKGWKYLINLSGQDYPIKSKTQIKAELERAWPRSFIRVWPFEKVREIDGEADPHLRRLATIEIFGKSRRLPFKLPATRLDVNYKGSQWHILSRPFCEWIAIDSNIARLKRYLRFSWVPDETFFQAAIMNSPFRDERMGDAARYFEFPGPKTLKSDSLPALQASDALFARKFDAEVDATILRAIADRCGYEVPPR